MTIDTMIYFYVIGIGVAFGLFLWHVLRQDGLTAEKLVVCAFLAIGSWGFVLMFILYSLRDKILFKKRGGK